MFYESHYPKEDLAKIANELESFSNRFLLYDSWCYELEKKCFIWFYFIRKLLESQYKITDSIKEQKIQVISYRFIWKMKLYQPSWGSDEYDYEHPTIEILSIRDMSHQFIHSQLFFWAKEWKWLGSVYVTSDYSLYKKIFEVNIKDIITIFRLVSVDYITSTQATRDPDTGKVVIINK